jgi:hypothetical protein
VPVANQLRTLRMVARSIMLFRGLSSGAFQVFAAPVDLPFPPTSIRLLRFSHGASSSRKVYQSSFIPGLHDTCVIFRKPRKGEYGLSRAA